MREERKNILIGMLSFLIGLIIGYLTTIIFSDNNKCVHTDTIIYIETTQEDNKEEEEATYTDAIEDAKEEDISKEQSIEPENLYDSSEEPTSNVKITEEQVNITDSNGMTYLGTYSLTAYCSCSLCCGNSNGITASGTQATSGRTVACNSIALGTTISINGNTYVVEDRGGMGGNVIDIFFDNHQDAINFGRQSADVYLVE